MFFQDKNIPLQTTILFAALLFVGALLTGCSSDSTSAAHGHELTLEGTGFGDHAGQTMTVAVEHQADGDVVGTDSATIADDGTFSVVVSDALEEDEAFHVYYFADVDSDSHCDMAEGDVVWEYDLDIVEGDEVVAVTYDGSIVSDSCAAFADSDTAHGH